MPNTQMSIPRNSEKEWVQERHADTITNALVHTFTHWGTQWETEEVLFEDHCSIGSYLVLSNTWFSVESSKNVYYKERKGRSRKCDVSVRKNRGIRKKMGGKECLHICACGKTMASVLECHCSRNPHLVSLDVIRSIHTIHDGTVIKKTCRVGLVASTASGCPEICYVFPVLHVPTQLDKLTFVWSKKVIL